MSVGLKIVAAAANNRPVDIKNIVEEALFQRAEEVISEGFTLVAERIYGGLEEKNSLKDPHNYYKSHPEYQAGDEYVSYHSRLHPNGTRVTVHTVKRGKNLKGLVHTTHKDDGKKRDRYGREIVEASKELKDPYNKSYSSFKRYKKRVGMHESITPIGSGSISKTNKTLTMKSTDSSGKTTTKKKSIKEYELEEGRTRKNLDGGKAESGYNRKDRKSFKNAKKSSEHPWNDAKNMHYRDDHIKRKVQRWGQYVSAVKEDELDESRARLGKNTIGKLHEPTPGSNLQPNRKTRKANKGGNTSKTDYYRYKSSDRLNKDRYDGTLDYNER